jgi:hypothetical protein
MADHYDTAFCEDVFEDTGQRISTPGADDNVSGSVALLMAAITLRHLKFCNEIWLVHFTGLSPLLHFLELVIEKYFLIKRSELNYVKVKNSLEMIWELVPLYLHCLTGNKTFKGSSFLI